MSSGTQNKDAATIKLEQSALLMSFKKQVAELRKQKEEADIEIEDLKRSTKVCVFNELDVQLEAYSDECKRMRSLLNEAMTRKIELEKDVRALNKQVQAKSAEKNRGDGDPL